MKESECVNQGIYVRYIKRILDIIFSLFALILLLPVNLIIGVCTYIDVGRPIFFRQARSGKDAVDFYIIKFRNMTNEKDEKGNLLPPSKRVTTFGKFVRRTSLDELLNFWSILKGDMSLIGPRPLLPIYVSRYTQRQRLRLAVRPGLECPSTINRGHPRSWEEQFEDEVWYVENISFVTDCKMIFRLIQMVFNRKDTARRGNAQRMEFMGTKDGEKHVQEK